MHQREEGVSTGQLGVRSENKEGRLLDFEIFRLWMAVKRERANAIHFVFHPIKAAVEFVDANVGIARKHFRIPPALLEAVDE